MSEDTIFSKIIAREIPAEIVYEDDDIIAFLDINPVNHGDTLVVPKKYSSCIFDIDEVSWSKLAETARILAPKIKEALNADGVVLVMNNEGTQLVPHSHIHLIPRFDDDGVQDWQGTSYPDGEMEIVANTIREVVAQ